MKEIVIYGAGSFAKMMRLYLDRVEGQRVVAFSVDQEFMGEEGSFDGLPVVAFEDVQRLYPTDRFLMFVAVGYSTMRARKLMYDKARLKGYRFISYVDSSAIIDETVSIGNNNVILMGSILEAFSSLGDNNIIWASVIISHDVKVGSHCFFASQSLIGGNCYIGDNCFFGFNSTCIQDVNVGNESLVGAKSLVLSNTAEFSQNIGIPAKQVSSHRDTGIFIK